MPGCALYRVAVITGEFSDDLQQGGAVVLYRLSVAAEPSLVLGAQHGDAGLQLRQAVPDVVHEQPAESFGQIAGAAAGGQRGVVALQEGLLIPR